MPLATSCGFQLQQSLIFEHAEVVFPGFKLMRSKGFGLEAGWRKFEQPVVRLLHKQNDFLSNSYGAYLIWLIIEEIRAVCINFRSRFGSVLILYSSSVPCYPRTL